jgi:hypothetical protein
MNNFSCMTTMAPSCLFTPGSSSIFFGMMMCSISTQYYQFILSQGILQFSSHCYPFTRHTKHIQVCARQSAMLLCLLRPSAQPAPGFIKCAPLHLDSCSPAPVSAASCFHLLGASLSSLGLGWAIRICTFISTHRDLAPTTDPEACLDHESHPAIERTPLPNAQRRLRAFLPGHIPTLQLHHRAGGIRRDVCRAGRVSHPDPQRRQSLQPHNTRQSRRQARQAEHDDCHVCFCRDYRAGAVATGDGECAYYRFFGAVMVRLRLRLSPLSPTDGANQ